MIYKGCSKFIISNNNIILEKANDWFRYPFYPEKTIDDRADYDVVIENKDNVDNYVKLYIIRDDSTDYSSDKYIQFPIDNVKKADLENSSHINGNLLSISARAITKFMQDKL